MDTILEMQNVNYYYKTKTKVNDILDNVNFSFERGKLYAIVGSSGAGKTTMLSLLGAMDIPKEGSVLYKGQDIKEIGYNNYRNRYIGIVFQAYNLLNYLSPIQNVMAAMEITKGKIENKKERAYAILKEMELDESIFHRNINMLSGGEQQRVAIARAIAKKADIILADEPTGNLDIDTAKGIINLFMELAHKNDKCVIVVTHSEEFTKQADITLRLYNKRLILL